MTDIPYFMTNDKWFEFDLKQRKYVLTDDAPEKARKSYKDYYDSIYGGRENDNGRDIH